MATWLLRCGSIRNSAEAVAGIRIAGSGTDNGEDAGDFWTNPGNAAGSNSSTYADYTCNGHDLSNGLVLDNYGLSLPEDAVIVGITATLNTSGSDEPRTPGESVWITKDGNPDAAGTITSGSWSGGAIVVGGSSDLWGLTWTRAEIQASTFGLMIYVEADVGVKDYRVHTAQLSVRYRTATKLITTYTYDPCGRPVSNIDANAARTTNVYDKASNVKVKIDPAGKRWSTVYDTQFRPVANINPLGQRNTTVYDTNGRELARINALGQRTSTIYDSAGRTVAAINPLGNRVTAVYDEVGQDVARINPLGRRTTTVFDGAGRQIGFINPLSARVTIVYNADGNPTATIDPLERRTTNVYDTAGHAVASIDTAGQRTTSVYDAEGRRIAIINALNERTTTVYDSAGNVIAASPKPSMSVAHFFALR